MPAVELQADISGALGDVRGAAAGQARLTLDEARRVAANIAKLPELLSERE